MDLQMIPKRIKAYREAAGLSQKELAQRCGWLNDEGDGLQSRIGNYEIGRIPNIQDLDIIARALDVSILDLMGVTAADLPAPNDLLRLLVEVPESKHEALRAVLEALARE